MKQDSSTKKSRKEKTPEAAERDREKARQRYANDTAYREAVKARVRLRYASDEDYKERCRANSKAYQARQIANDPEFKKKESQRVLAYYYADKDGTREENRRAREQAREGIYNADDIARILKEQDGKCRYCSVDISEKRHIDHKIPLSRGGTNAPSNIVLTCPKCNLTKHAMTPEEFLAYARKKGLFAA